MLRKTKQGRVFLPTRTACSYKCLFSRSLKQHITCAGRRGGGGGAGGEINRLHTVMAVNTITNLKQQSENAVTILLLFSLYLFKRGFAEDSE